MLAAATIMMQRTASHQMQVAKGLRVRVRIRLGLELLCPHGFRVTIRVSFCEDTVSVNIDVKVDSKLGWHVVFRFLVKLTA